LHLIFIYISFLIIFQIVDKFKQFLRMFSNRFLMWHNQNIR